MLKKIQNKAESQLRFWHVVANEWPLAQRGSSCRLTPLTRYVLKKRSETGAVLITNTLLHSQLGLESVSWEL